MKTIICTTLTALIAGTAVADDPDIFFEPHLDLRLRYENVDQDGFDRDAEALTLRTRAGLGFGLGEAFGGLVEFEDIRALGIDDYNSTANGLDGHPVIADPEDTELNQAWLEWRPGANTGLRVGRQRIILGNARFVGNVGFRQNEQTFDAAGLRHGFGNGIDLDLIHVEQVNRIFGDSHPVDVLARTDVSAQLFNLGWTAENMTLTGYVYLLDNEDAPAASTRTFGLRWTGKVGLGGGDLRGAAEFATQEPHADGADTNDAGYHRIEAGWHIDPVGIDVAQETLGGDGAYGFSTPLATLHAFQGWADVFLATPPDGIRDRFVTVSGKLGRMTWKAVYHDFDADRGSADYGSELDFSLAHPLAWGITGKLEYADYDSDGFAADTRKVWLTLSRAW